MEQSIAEGTTAAIIVNVIGEDGNHTNATINTTTTRLSTHPSATPTVTQRDTGVYLVKWTGLSPALSISDNDNAVSAEINGTISGTAWTSYHIPITIVAAAGGGGGLDAAGVRAAVGLASANLDTQLADIPTVSEFESRTIVSSAYFDPSADSVITANASDVTAIKAVTDSLPDSGSLTSLATSSALSVVDTNVDSIKAKTDQFVFTVSNQVDSNSITGGISASEVEDAVWDAAYSSHTSAGTFGKLMDQLRKANRAIDGEVAGTPTVTAFDTNLTGYTSGAFDSELLIFVSGSLNGEARPILSYDSSAGRVTFEEAWTAAPSSSDEFVILPYHVHPVSEIAAGVLAGGDVDGFSLEETLKLCLSALAGKISGAGSGTVTIRSADDSKNRIIATTDSNGNRLSITIDKDG